MVLQHFSEVISLRCPALLKEGLHIARTKYGPSNAGVRAVALMQWHSK